jgi:hypothetical protein
VEQVDALDSKSSGPCARESSILSFGTNTTDTATGRRYSNVWQIVEIESYYPFWPPPFPFS